MDTIIIAVHVVTCLVLILVILLQSGKGADMGAAFGGAGSTVFGPSSGGNALTKITTGAAITFMCTSLALALLSARQTSIFDDVADPLDAPAAVSAPAEGAAENESPTASDFAVPPPAGPDGGAAATGASAPSAANAGAAAANELAGAAAHVTEAGSQTGAGAADTVGQAAGAAKGQAGTAATQATGQATQAVDNAEQ